MFSSIFANYNNVEVPYNVKVQQQEEVLNNDFSNVPTIQLSFEDTTSTEENKNNVTQFNTQETQQSSTEINNIIQNARQYLGQPYVWGGKTPKSGFDCSGLIGHVYKNAGCDIGSSTSQQFTAGNSVSIKDAKIGDIICTKGNGPTRRHVKMISKIENGQIYTIEAKGKKYGIVETPLKNTKNIVSVRRIINT